MDIPIRSTAAPELPPTREACRARLAELQSDISAIKAQIAAADLERQSRRGKMDSRLFHRAKTALRHKQREAAAITQHMATLPGGPSRCDGFKDCLIEVLRSDYEDDAWRSAIDRAHRLQDAREVL